VYSFDGGVVGDVGEAERAVVDGVVSGMVLVVVLTASASTSAGSSTVKSLGSPSGSAGHVH
jgi:hypothetical protein